MDSHLPLQKRIKGKIPLSVGRSHFQFLVNLQSKKTFLSFMLPNLMDVTEGNALVANKTRTRYNLVETAPYGDRETL